MTMKMTDIDRLLKFCCNDFERHTLCLDAPTAMMVCGSAKVEARIQVIDDALARGFIVRWTSLDGTDPVKLDPVNDRDAMVGINETREGQIYRIRSFEVI